MRREVRRCIPLVTLLVTLTMLASLPAADHRDGPRTTNSATSLGPLDINDVYLFRSPANANNTVMVLSCGGADVGVIGPPYFFPGGVYEIRVSNNGVKTDDEIVYQVVFSDPDKYLRQTYRLIEMRRVGLIFVSQVLTQGVTGRAVPLRGGGAVQAQLFDDPFFFDLNAFVKFRTAVQQGKPLGERVAPFLPPNQPKNFFTRNTLAIVLELPRLQLQSAPANPGLSVWARTLRPNGEQFDRMGRPGINTVVGFEQPLLGFPNIADTFNSLIPAQDPPLIPVAATRISTAFGLPLNGPVSNGGPNATQLAGILLPDVLDFDTTSSAGFLNGRRLADDVIDAELNLLTGGALTTDRVGNDSNFLSVFPYLAPPVP
jgi:hypothetical protein